MNCLVGQSGGPTSVINASLLGVIIGSYYSSDIDEIYGARYGIEGVLNNNIIDLTDRSKKELELLKYTPSSVLGSCRYKLPHFEEDEKDYEVIFNIFKKYNIRYFFYIGGNDSMDTVMKLNKYAREIDYKINIMGIPKTIDNDLKGTDHCPGYGSAAKYIATSVMEMARDGNVYNKENVHIIEVMGRDSGWLAAASILARNDSIGSPDLIYLPEVPFDKDIFMDEVATKIEEKKKINVIVAEGIKDKEGRYIMDRGVPAHDEFGHKQMGGVSSILGEMVKKELCDRVKTIEFNILQRAAAHLVSGNDVEEAFHCGLEGVKNAVNGETGKMVAIKRMSNTPYRCKYELIPIEEVANKEKSLPVQWIDTEKRSVTKEFINYVQPLIQGSVKQPVENGLVKYFSL